MPRVVPKRMNSHQRRERQKRKQYENERPELGGFIWQAVLISLVGCLFCAGKDWEEKVENAKISPEDKENKEEGEGERRHHRHVRGRSRRSRSVSDEGSEGAGRDYRHRDREGGDGSAYGGYEGRGGVNDGVTYITADSERYRGNDDRLRRYDVESQQVYEVEESPAPRRRRIRRGESFE